jgi:outer membrane receptor protein involved in Fe transport
LSSRAVNELHAQVATRSQSNERFSATSTGPAISIAGVANFGGPIDVGFAYTETTPEIADNFSLITGGHELKVGFNTRWIRDEQVAATGALYTFSTIAAYQAAVTGADPKSYVSFIQAYGNPAIRYNSLFFGGFAQDTWKPRRDLTVTYGLRYDVYRPPQANRNAPFPYSQSFRTDKNNFAPRLGLAWSLDQQQKTIVRASTGIFYDPLETDQYRLALLQNGLQAFFMVSALPTQPFAPGFPTVCLRCRPA